MPSLVKTESAVDLTTRFWNRSSKVQKEQMLTALGYNKSFAQAKTMPELVRRGGGFVAKDIFKVAKIWRKRNPYTTIKD